MKSFLVKVPLDSWTNDCSSNLSDMMKRKSIIHSHLFQALKLLSQVS